MSAPPDTSAWADGDERTWTDDDERELQALQAACDARAEEWRRSPERRARDTRRLLREIGEFSAVARAVLDDVAAAPGWASPAAALRVCGRFLRGARALAEDITGRPIPPAGEANPLAALARALSVRLQEDATKRAGDGAITTLAPVLDLCELIGAALLHAAERTCSPADWIAHRTEERRQSWSAGVSLGDPTAAPARAYATVQGWPADSRTLRWCGGDGALLVLLPDPAGRPCALLAVTLAADGYALAEDVELLRSSLDDAP